jgi:O-succinylbenzoic acid--CoA ligase
MKILTSIQPGKVKINTALIAVIQNNNQITYLELSSIVGKTAHFLNKKGIKENDITALLSKNSWEFIVSILALWEIGAVPVALNTKLLSKDLEEQIGFLNPNSVIKSKSINNISLQKKNIIIPFDDLPEDEYETKITDFSKQKTALILFTSGASGKPKAVTLSFENLIQSALTGKKVLNQTSDDKWLASLPFYHIGGFSIIFRALMFGTSIIIPDSLSKDDLIQSINRYKPTLASLVSNQLKKFVDSDFMPPKELRTVLLGGGFFHTDLILKAIDKGWKIAKVYGSTETSSFVSFMNYEELKRKPGASGKTIPPNKIIITDEGEIAVQSHTVMKGYYNNDEETFSRLKNDFYYSGDQGYIDDEGYLFVEARRNDLIVSGGENINPVEVENIILLNSKIKEACVVGIENKQWGQIVAAAIVVKENEKLSEIDLINYLKERLASFKIPKKIIFIDQLPKSELGKVIREKVRELLIV